MTTSSYLLLDKVRDACADFLGSKIDFNNVLGSKRFASSALCSHLAAAANEYIYDNFMKVAKCEEFLELEFEEVIDLLQTHTLNISNEEVMFDACLRWTIHNTRLRAHLLAKLIALCLLTVTVFGVSGTSGSRMAYSFFT